MNTTKFESPGPYRRVLIIGMLDSIHLYRWLEQFKEEKIKFFIFPSKKYRYINNSLLELINSKSTARFKLITNLGRISGFFDYSRFELPKKFGFGGFRKLSISKLLRTNSYDFIHALEIQGAGYLLAQVEKDSLSGTKVILTNWGSDIYYFKHFPKDEKLIRTALSKTDFYAAECKRDYALARDLGFMGKDLPCIPNAGGFKTDDMSLNIATSARKQIMIKGYGGRFGRADIPIKLIPQIVEEFPDMKFFIFSVTRDILEIINSLPSVAKSRIKISTVRNKLSRDDFLKEFGRSRVYIGCSSSDGISTSFLEALIYGTYPIQTNTSCATEWIAKGYVASLVNVDLKEILNATYSALGNDLLVDQAAKINSKLVREHLDYAHIRDKALTFYMG